MRLKEYDVDPIDVDADGIAQSQTLAAGGAQSLTLNGALVTGGVFRADFGGRRIGIASVGNDSARTFTVTGTDPDGYALTEAVTGANAGTAESTEYFATVSSVTVDDDTAAAVAVGTVDELCSKTLPLDWRADDAARLNVDVTGTINYTIQETFDDVQRPGQLARSAYQNSQWIDITALASQTGDVTSETSRHATAFRIVVNSYSSGAELQVNRIQVRNA